MIKIMITQSKLTGILFLARSLVELQLRLHVFGWKCDADLDTAGNTASDNTFQCFVAAGRGVSCATHCLVVCDESDALG